MGLPEISARAEAGSGAALAALRERTRAAHVVLERDLHVASPAAGREQYARHVAALWGWMKPIETALWGGPWPAAIDVAARAEKSTWLETDIAAARVDGMLAAPIEVGEDADCASRGARFGLAYVIEGSMLGGLVLLRRLGPRLAPWPARYLRGYGTRTQRYWRDFLAAMAGELVRRDEVDEAAEAAGDAFRSLGRWMRAQGAARSR